MDSLRQLTLVNHVRSEQECYHLRAGWSLDVATSVIPFWSMSKLSTGFCEWTAQEADHPWKALAGGGAASSATSKTVEATVSATGETTISIKPAVAH